MCIFCEPVNCSSGVTSAKSDEEIVYAYACPDLPTRCTVNVFLSEKAVSSCENHNPMNPSVAHLDLNKVSADEFVDALKEVARQQRGIQTVVLFCNIELEVEVYLKLFWVDPFLERNYTLGQVVILDLDTTEGVDMCSARMLKQLAIADGVVDKSSLFEYHIVNPLLQVVSCYGDMKDVYDCDVMSDSDRYVYIPLLLYRFDELKLTDSLWKCVNSYECIDCIKGNVAFDHGFNGIIKSIGGHVDIQYTNNNPYKYTTKYILIIGDIKRIKQTLIHTIMPQQ